MWCVSISSEVKRCILASTNQVLWMRVYIKTDTDFGADFEQKCADVDKAALQVLHDVGEIPWNRVGMEQKYGNLDVKAADVAQLQSASDVMFDYLAEQEDYIPKNLRGG